MAIVLDGTTGITTPAETVSGAITASTVTATGLISGSTDYTGFKNRIINGGMVIDQRNAGASVTPTDALYTLDRWVAGLTQASKFTVQQSSTAPAGFINSLVATSSSAYSITSGDFFGISQKIEGFNVADLGWGTANAQTVTLSFWVRSSLTGTFGGSFINSAGDRSYPFSYTVSSANTLEQKTITVAGDTSGAWLTTNGTGVRLTFSIGMGSSYSGTAGAWAGSGYYSATGATSVVGTSGATFYITGVQLEKGSTATSFDYRPYGTELALCQRYYEKSFDYATVPANGGASSLSTISGAFSGYVTNASNGSGSLSFKISKRATPTFTSYGNSSGYWYAGGYGANSSLGTVSQNGFVSNQQQVAGFQQTYGHWTAISEL